MVSNPARNAAASHHAFDFELADIGPAAIKVLRHADALTVAGFAIAVERQAWRRTGDQWRRSQSSCLFLLRRGRILRLQRQREGGL